MQMPKIKKIEIMKKLTKKIKKMEKMIKKKKLFNANYLKKVKMKLIKEVFLEIKKGKKAIKEVVHQKINQIPTV